PPTSNIYTLSLHDALRSTGVLCDQIISLKGYKSQKHYPEKLRRIKFYDQDLGRTFVFITNNFELNALDIALLYKHRWSVVSPQRSEEHTSELQSPYDLVC